MIYSLAGVAIPLGLVQVGLDLHGLRSESHGLLTAGSVTPEVTRRTREIFLWILALIGGVFLVGFHLTLPLFALLYAKIYGARWRAAIFLALLAEGFLVLLFDQLLHVVWPDPLLLSFLS